MAQTSSLIISGGGIGGLAAALVLAQDGHAGVQRELRNQLFQSGTESAGFAGLKWMYDGIEPSKLFQ